VAFGKKSLQAPTMVARMPRPYTPDVSDRDRHHPKEDHDFTKNDRLITKRDRLITKDDRDQI
jgi:hypothetical protein